MKRKTENSDVWFLVQHRQGKIEEPTFGLLGEAQRLSRNQGKVAAVVLGWGLDQEINVLEARGADKILYVKDEGLAHFHGEAQAAVLAGLLGGENPLFLLMAHSAETADLAPRLAAALGTGLVTRAMDLNLDAHGKVAAVRPIANGYLFQELEFQSAPPYLVTFVPSVLSSEEVEPKKAEVLVVSPQEDLKALKTQVKALVPPDLETLDLEEADVIVSGGRGVGKGESFRLLHDLAGAIGGTVSGTRPIIDWQMLPYERQIGQTGKSVTPRLLIACGISGANEYTVGMEKSQLVIAINTDARARIFRFADLGVVGDVHEVLPLLIRRLRES
ncbi:MAG: electron transfer flavoprotein subunit alpha/FixB family protein [Deltaproteobacteria bacterium]